MRETIRVSVMFKFLHTSDLHLGKSFASLPVDLAALLKNSRLDQIESLRAIAAREGIAHIVVAGDFFHDAVSTPQLRRQAYTMLADDETISWWILPGNHDPLTAKVWDEFWQKPLHHVHIISDTNPIEVEPGVFLMPAPIDIPFGRTGQDRTAHWGSQETPKGSLRIGVAHGSVLSFGSDEDMSRLKAERWDEAKMDYVALGDWHGQKKVSRSAWYSGVAEADGFSSQGSCLIVEIDQNGPKVRPVLSGTWTWSVIDVNFLDENFDRAIDIVKSNLPKSRKSKTLVRLDVKGRLRPDVLTQFLENITDLGLNYAFFDVRTQDLKPVIDPDMIAASVPVGTLRDAMLYLATKAQSGDEGSQDAERALFKLAATIGDFKK